jgi:hypothetical protein
VSLDQSPSQVLGIKTGELSFKVGFEGCKVSWISLSRLTSVILRFLAVSDWSKRNKSRSNA